MMTPNESSTEGPETAEQEIADERPSGPPDDITEGTDVLMSRAALFLSSYAPLLVILAIRFDALWLRCLCGALALFGFALLIATVFVLAGRQQARPYPVDDVRDASNEVAGYLATYLLPFVAVPVPSGADLVGYLVWAIVVLAIFLRTELVQINPTLYLIGWRVVGVEVAGERTYLVCRRVPRTSTEISAVRVGGMLIRREQ